MMLTNAKRHECQLNGVVHTTLASLCSQLTNQAFCKKAMALETLVYSK